MLHDREAFLSRSLAVLTVAVGLTLMTRNVFLGGDVLSLLQADFEDPFSVIAVANVIWNQVQASYFQERAVALVDEIEAADPDLLGVQEAVRYGHVKAGPDGPETTVIDFIGMIQEEIDRRGLPYSLLAIQENTSTVVPLAAVIVNGGVVFTEVVQFTEGVAVVVRDGFPVRGVTHANYATTHLPGGGIVQKRGWIRVDARIDGRPHHFVVTHLEVQAFEDAQVAQAGELLSDVAGGLDGVTFLLGDFNSNAASDPGDPTWTPTYDAILDAGFRDLWAFANPRKPDAGLTCCNDVDLRNPEPNFEQRIDFIFFRSSEPSGGTAQFPGPLSVEVVGDKPGSRTSPHGLWASDHAGLVARLWAVPGRNPLGP